MNSRLVIKTDGFAFNWNLSTNEIILLKSNHSYGHQRLPRSVTLFSACYTAANLLLEGDQPQSLSV